MKTLSKQQQDILLDYYFECANQDESDTAKKLLLTDCGAREFYDKLHHSLSALEQLDTHTQQSCPDHLVEQTLEKLYNHQSVNASSANKLGQLLANESEKIVTKRPSFWRSFSEAISVAAAIVILSGLFVPITRQMRAQAWQTACQANLNSVSKSVAQYAGDNQGFLPAVQTRAGNPWWKVGSTQPQNQSNTRHVWLLVKRNYVNPKSFICPGNRNKSLPVLETEQIQSLPDFPDRRYITYSFKLISDMNNARMPSLSSPLMSDANPIFETCVKCPKNMSNAEFNPVQLNEKLRRANSKSHRGRGQNIMFSDGSVKFTSQRVFNDNDDIFTLQGRDTYNGTETPTGDKDIFLVP
ncbi:MAG: hypothetical protein LLF92_11990 [Planctomycetaceae bacterium]|nr:hypothetical protein [Planctomycetaceae bacterium]